MRGRKGDDVPPQVPAWAPGVDEEAMEDSGPPFVWEPGDRDDE